MLLRITLLLLLSGLSLPLLANEGRMANPDGDGGCPSVVAEERGDPRDGSPAPDTESVSKDKTAQPRRGGNAENGVRGPRMHNLLPGMFR